MLQPSIHWCWYYDSHRQLLALELEDLLFLTPYQQRQLVSESTVRQGFSLDDLGFYTDLADKLLPAKLDYNEGQLSQILLNATAVKRFYRPQMPKSWYFKRQLHAGLNHGMATVETAYGQATVLVIEREKSASLCMLLSPELVLDEHHHLSQFGVIKVFNDCLIPHFSVPDAGQKTTL